MPFSIVTKDGIKINNIPDDVDPNSDELRQRVEQLRASRSVSQEVVQADVLPGLPARAIAALSPLAQILKATGIEESPEQAIETGLISAGRGLTTIGRGLGLVEPEAPEVTGAFEQLEEQRPVATTIGEIAGQAAPFIAPGLGVSAIPGLAARVAGTGILGASEGGLITRGEDASGEQQAIAAGLGGIVAGAAELVLPVLGRIGGQIIRSVLNKAPEGAVVDAAGNPSQELITALEQSGQTFDDVIDQTKAELTGQAVDPEQAARKAFLESQGLSPTQAQISRNAADFQAQQESAKTSGRVREALEKQEAVLTSRFNNAVLETGGQAVTPTSTVTDALVGKATVLDQKISDLYAVAREVAPGEKNVRLSGLAKKLRELAPSNRRAGGNIEAVVGDLQAKGVLDADMNVIGKIDVETAEDVRKLTNELFDPQNGFGNIKLREIKEALDEDVFKAAGRDVFQEARKAKRDFEIELTRSKISKFDSRKTNVVRDILENKIDPDRFADSVVFSKKYRAEDLQQLKDYIGTDDAGRQAFDDLRADVLDSIKKKAFIGPEDAVGNKALSRDKLERAIASVGDQKLKILFSPDERRFLDDMVKLSKLREPVRGTQQGRGPTAQAVRSLEDRISKLPILGAIVDAIDIDASGRAVLRAKPQRLIPSIKARPETQALAQAAGIASVAALQEEQ